VQVIVEKPKFTVRRKTMRTLLLFCILVALPILSWGQGNLVPNSGFEEHTVCPWIPTQIALAAPWQASGIEDSPDYFHVCCVPEIMGSDTSFRMGVPTNVIGMQHANSGDGYAGFFAVSNQELYPNFREYVQVELTEPIHAGVRYEVSFHVSLADKWWYAVGSFGAYFSETPIYRENGDVLDVEPQIQSPEGVIYDSKEEWTEVRDTFDSRYGGERYMLIGNFRPDSLSSITFVDSGATNTHNRSYYYIDDVSVIALDSIPNSITEPATELALTLTVWPNPATSLLHIRSGLPLARLRLLDLSGRAVHAQEAHGTTHTIPLHTLPAGLYLLEAEDTTGRKAVQRVVKVT
jgi:hypothetical protein